MTCFTLVRRGYGDRRGERGGEAVWLRKRAGLWCTEGLGWELGWGCRMWLLGGGCRIRGNELLAWYDSEEMGLME